MQAKVCRSVCTIGIQKFLGKPAREGEAHVFPGIPAEAILNQPTSNVSVSPAKISRAVKIICSYPKACEGGSKIR